MTPFNAEAMVAALGLDRILAGTPSYTVEAQEAAVSFPKRARAWLLKALGNRDPEPDSEEPPDFDYDDASKLLLNVGEGQNQALFDALPDDVQDDVLAAATNAIEYLQAQLPRRVVKTTAREIVEPPEPYELDRFARTWRVAVSPMWALRSMAVGGLDMVMVEALETMYPELYKLVAREGGLLDDAIAAMKARRGDKWDVTDDQDRQVKILLGEDPIDLDLANDYAATQPIAPAPGKRPRATPAQPVAELLPGQKQA